MMRGYVRLVRVLVLAQLGYYNRRDQFAHWVRKEQPTGRPCQHACCRGLRAHPEGHPVAKRNRYLRYSSDDELARYWARHPGDSPADERARDQVLVEMQRRDVGQERRERTEQRRQERWSNRQRDRAIERERLYVEAEAAIKGYMLNRRGREAGIDPRTLFTGPESRARKYASEELFGHRETHARPTEAYWRGENTRIRYYGRRTARNAASPPKSRNGATDSSATRGRSRPARTPKWHDAAMTRSHFYAEGNLAAEHAPHPVTDLPSLDDDPRCQALLTCQNPKCKRCGEPRECGARAIWVWIGPCAACRKPVPSLLWRNCASHSLAAGWVRSSQLRPLD
jgi:hypothetical protein